MDIAGAPLDLRPLHFDSGPMTSTYPLLLLFACGWLLAVLWLVLISSLLNQLFRNEAEAYSALGSPVVRWLWWSWPTPEMGRPPFLSLTGLAKGRLELSTMYSPQEVRSISKVAIWIFFNRPNLEVGRPTKRQQRRIRVCGIGFLICLVGVVVLAAVGPA
jgi:hypothetical protein